jgi:hypothetical protein
MPGMSRIKMWGEYWPASHRDNGIPVVLGDRRKIPFLNERRRLKWRDEIIPSWPCPWCASTEHRYEQPGYQPAACGRGTVQIYSPRTWRILN